MGAAASSLAAAGSARADVQEQEFELSLMALHLSGAEKQQAHAAAALDVCIQRHLAAEDVVRLWASSRALQQLCSSRLSSVIVRSVAAAAQARAAASAAAAAAGPPPARTLADDAPEYPEAVDEGNSTPALLWLLRQPAVTAATINQCNQQLLAIPSVPMAAAKALVRAGLRVQVTAQQLVARAYDCFEGLGVWVAAFDAAKVPLQEWAADLPPELREVCCCRRLGKAESDQQRLVQDLTPARVADLLAVSFGVAACERPVRNYSDWKANQAAEHNVNGLFFPLGHSAIYQLPAAAVEPLLRLAVKHHIRTNKQKYGMAGCWPFHIKEFCRVPAAAQLTTATVVDLAEQTVHIPNKCTGWSARPFFELLASRDVTEEQLERLLPLMQCQQQSDVAANTCEFLTLPNGELTGRVACQPSGSSSSRSAGGSDS